MKNLRSIFNNMLVLLVTFSLLTVTSCKKDDDPAPVFTMESLMAGDIDLAGVTSATDVPEDAVITAVFSSAVDETTISASSITISTDAGNIDLDFTVSDKTVTIEPVEGLDGGSQFTIVLSSSIKGTNGVAFEGITLTFRTSGIFVPSKENQVLHISFDGETVVDDAGDHTVTPTDIEYVADRWGTAGSAAYFNGQGNLVEVLADADLISPSITISFWIKTDLADYDGGDGTGQPQTRFVIGLGAELGYFLEMGRRSNDPAADAYNEIFLKYATDHVNIGLNADAVPKATAWSEVNSQINVNYEAGTQSGWSYAIDQLQADPPNRDYVNNEIMGEWTQIVMTFDKTSQTKTIYVNGTKWAAFTWISSGAEWLFSDLSLKTNNNDGSPVDGLEGSLALGFLGSKTNTATGWAIYDNYLANPAESKKFFKGAMDEFRIFNIALTSDNVKILYDNEK